MLHEHHHSSISRFIQMINQSEFWKSQITQLHFLDNEVVLIPRVGNHKIHFGMLVNAAEKLANAPKKYSVMNTVIIVSNHFP